MDTPGPLSICLTNMVIVFGVLIFLAFVIELIHIVDPNRRYKMDGFMRALVSVWTDSGFAALTWENCVMILVGLVLLYLSIAKEYEPLLLLPIAFGCIMANFPNTGFEDEMGVMMAIANPKTMLLGAAAQIGVFVALAGAMMLGFNVQEAASIGIIGGADGPTAIYLTSKLAPHLLGAIAVAAYSYMSLVPLIQPPIMKMCTTKEQRKIKMVNLRPVSHFEKVLFPIVVAIVVSLLLPPVAALMGCLCMGNLFEVSGVTARLSDTAQNALINIVTIFLATGTGLTMSGDKFLRLETIEIICLGLVAFAAGTAGGVVFGQIMRIASGNKINPLIGSAGVSAVPMAARVSQVVGLKDNPSNYLLMQAMGPNVAGVIGTAVAAGTMLAQFGG